MIYSLQHMLQFESKIANILLEKIYQSIEITERELEKQNKKRKIKFLANHKIHVCNSYNLINSR